MVRAPRDRADVSVPVATYQRAKAYAESVGMSVGAVVDEITRGLGGAR
jgi:hypothetical protein